jgi:hypothetical protein
MNEFQTNKIPANGEIVAEQLRLARLKKKESLSEAAAGTKIGVRYLEALETGRFEKLPRGLYGKNYLAEYASYLRLDAPELLGLLAAEAAENDHIGKNDFFPRHASRSLRFLSLPKIFKSLVVASIVTVCLVYLVSCFRDIISPPALTVINPQTNLVTGQLFVNIEGRTEPDAQVSINGLPILANADGSFRKKVNLKNGLNTILITAQKKYSRKNNIVKKILVDTATSRAAVGNAL